MSAKAENPYPPPGGMPAPAPPPPPKKEREQLLEALYWACGDYFVNSRATPWVCVERAYNAIKEYDAK